MRRSPHGERGLKLRIFAVWVARGLVSLPTRGAWIETSSWVMTDQLLLVAPHTGSVD
jgi:hypothetical protein